MMLAMHRVAPWVAGLVGIAVVLAGLIVRSPGWLSAALLVLGSVLAIVSLSVSLRRWMTPPATTPEGKEAEARLWSTKIGDQGGGF